MVPDVQEARFTQTINEGGPEAIEEPQGEEIYADEEEAEAGIPTGAAFVEVPRMQPVERVDVSVDAPGPSLLKPRKPIPRGPREPIEDIRLTQDIMTEIDVYWGFGKIPETRSVAPLRTYLSNINRTIGTDYATNVNREELLKNIRAALRDSYRKIPETEVE
jgi:hypothetical protein